MEGPTPPRLLPASRRRMTRVASTHRLARRTIWKRLWVVSVAFLVLSILGVGPLIHHIYFDPSHPPPLGPFIRFELPTVGIVYDAHGEVLFELAHEYRRVVKYEEIPPVVRDAILSAEEKNFFSPSGCDYGSFPRVLWSNLVRSVRGSRPDSGPDPRPNRGLTFSQGGSTITQQLVRGYFLRDMTTGEEDNRLVRNGFLSRMAARVLGASGTKKLLRKMERGRV